MPSKESVSQAVTIVDDEPMVQDLLVRAARSWNYEVQTASSAEECLTALERKGTPIVVTDLNMPGQGGVWLVRQIRARWPKIAVVVITAGQGPNAAVECLNAGAHRYFHKPIVLDEFRHALDASLRTWRLQEEHDCYHERLKRTVHRQTRKIRRTFLCAIDSLVRTVEARDHYTSGHSLRVRQYSLRLAETLNLDEPLRKELGLAAKLHDIGKVGVPDVILNKPGLLTEQEFDVVRQHPVIGERILAPIIRSLNILGTIRSHHERVDGHGYPDGLSGDDIPLLARVLAVADCFDALTTARAYRPAMAVDQAAGILEDGAGTQFQPEFVRAFLDLALPTLQAQGELIRSGSNGLVALPAQSPLQLPDNGLNTNPLSSFG
jgi:response regulator RpfG family c-di-GMP phosphodiesterase